LGFYLMGCGAGYGPGYGVNPLILGSDHLAGQGPHKGRELIVPSDPRVPEDPRATRGQVGGPTRRPLAADAAIRGQRLRLR